MMSLKSIRDTSLFNKFCFCFEPHAVDPIFTIDRAFQTRHQEDGGADTHESGHTLVK